MTASVLILLIIGLSILAFLAGRFRAARAQKNGRLKALPKHYGYYTAIWSGLPALILLVAWSALKPVYIHEQIREVLPQSVLTQSNASVDLYMNDILLAIQNNDTRDDPVLIRAVDRYQQLQQESNWILTVLVVLLGLSGIVYAMTNSLLRTQARSHTETVIRVALFICSGVAIVTTIGIVLSVLFESLRFFQSVNFFDFVFGTKWSPQIAIRADQAGSSGAFGAVPLFFGTLLISAIALLIAVPVGLFSAIYLSEYASQRFRATAKPALEILAGIPTVVYGFFAALTVAPFIRDLGQSIGLDVSSESALAAGVVMGVMIIPFVSSLSDDVITAVPQAMRDGSLGLGATRSETIKQVIIPAALPGIVGGVLLAASRAIGETMIVVMAAGLSANLTANPLEAVTTVTVQIVTLLTGDQEFDSPKTLAAFALGLMLFVTTLVLNVFALHIVRKYREQYE